MLLRGLHICLHCTHIQKEGGLNSEASCCSQRPLNVPTSPAMGVSENCIQGKLNGLQPCRPQPAYSADVRIATDAASSNSSEALSFGKYASASEFQTHANFNASADGTLALSAADISILPSRGTASMGLGEYLQFGCKALLATCLHNLPDKFKLRSPDPCRQLALSTLHRK